MDVSPEGVSELERANQSKCGLTHFIKSLKHATLEKLRSRRGGADGSRATWTKPRRGERAGASESIEVRVNAFH